MLIFLSFPPFIPFCLFTAARLIRPDVSDPFHRRSPRMPSDPLQNSSRGRPGRAPWKSTRWSSRCPMPNGLKVFSESPAVFGKTVPISSGLQTYSEQCGCACVSELCVSRDGHFLISLQHVCLFSWGGGCTHQCARDGEHAHMDPCPRTDNRLPLRVPPWRRISPKKNSSRRQHNTLAASRRCLPANAIFSLTPTSLNITQSS